MPNVEQPVRRARIDDPMADVATIASIDVIPTILEVVCRVTGMGFAAVARVTDERWIACAVRDEIAFGLMPGGELRVETTICSEIRDSGQAVVIDHAAQDEAFCGHPTPALYGFQSYISMPILRPDGSFFGTLCAIDPRPMRLKTPETMGMFRLFSNLIGLHLDARERLATSEAALLGEREAAELRDQFIAVLGHDLRNPLAALDAGTRLLGRSQLDETGAATLKLMQDTVRRMAGLIDNVLDFARGKLGGGLPVSRTPTQLQQALLQVVAEQRAARPDRVIDADIALTDRVVSDPGRIAQLLSNLLSNALTHGGADRPVSISASTKAGVFELSVANAGEPIPAENIDRLFQPFFRASRRSGHQGLGLGLYIASEIGRAHGGTLNVASTAEETRFTFRMPIR